MDLIIIIAVLILTLATGLIGGWVIFDSVMRRRALAQVEAAHADLKDTLAKVSDAHNGLAKEIVSMQDRLNAHEFKLSGRATSSTQWPKV